MFCGFELDDTISNHSTFSKTRTRKWQQSDLFQKAFYEIVKQCIDSGLIDGEAMAADGSYIPANVSRESWINVETEVEQSMQSYLDSLDEELSNQPGFKKPPTKIVRKCRTTSQTDSDSGYINHGSKRGIGHAKEAAMAVRDWTFANTMFGVVYSYMKKENIPSPAVARAGGMTLLGEFTDGEGEQTVVYGISREESERHMDIWERLYKRAKNEYHPEDVSPFIQAHHVVCVLESGDGTIYTGFCIEACSGVMNLCAERVAALNMYASSGQTRIKRLIAFRDRAPYGDGSGMPCGASREFLYQLNEENENTEIMVDYESRKTVTLRELLPGFWGKERYSNNKAL